VAGYDAGELFAAEILDALASTISAEDLQLYYQMALLGRRDLDLAPDARGGFEMVLLRMLAFSPESISQAPTPTAGRALAGRAAAGLSELTVESWPTVLATLDVQGAARRLAANCTLLGREGNRLRLALDPRSAHYRTPQSEATLNEALARTLGVNVSLGIELADSQPDTPARQESRAANERLQAARNEIENDPTVKALQERFGATIVPDSIKPLS
jgi:DNA polymerase-3 subunit gamma/tau